MLRYTMTQAERNGIEVDRTTGTGWPFGGPWVPLKESACRVVFVEKDINGTGTRLVAIRERRQERLPGKGDAL